MYRDKSIKKNNIMLILFMFLVWFAPSFIYGSEIYSVKLIVKEILFTVIIFVGAIIYSAYKNHIVCICVFAVSLLSAFILFDMKSSIALSCLLSVIFIFKTKDVTSVIPQKFNDLILIVPAVLASIMIIDDFRSIIYSIKDKGFLPTYTITLISLYIIFANSSKNSEERKKRCSLEKKICIVSIIGIISAISTFCNTLRLNYNVILFYWMLVILIFLFDDSKKEVILFDKIINRMEKFLN